MNKSPLTIGDFQKAWSILLSKDEETKHMPLHPFGSFRNGSGARATCKACGFYMEGQSIFRYSSICYGRRRFWFFRLLCPLQPHYHVKCSECKAMWFEAMETD